MLEPGTYIDSAWGHYQTPRTIELALDLGWEPADEFEDWVRNLIERYNDNDLSDDEADAIYETADEAIDWINDTQVPEGHWFGHHPDIGDVGVWELEEDE